MGFRVGPSAGRARARLVSALITDKGCARLRGGGICVDKGCYVRGTSLVSSRGIVVVGSRRRRTSLICLMGRTAASLELSGTNRVNRGIFGNQGIYL